MSKKMDSVTMTVLSGCLLLLVIWLSVASANVPKIWAPHSIFLFLIGFSLPNFGWLTTPLLFFLLPIFMWLWNPGAFAGNVNVPKRSFALLLLIALLSALYNFSGWSYGLRYQGRTYTIAVITLNAALLISLLLLSASALETPSFRKNLAFHWLLFAWLTTYAFPYLGELI